MAATLSYLYTELQLSIKMWSLKISCSTTPSMPKLPILAYLGSCLQTTLIQHTSAYRDIEYRAFMILSIKMSLCSPRRASSVASVCCWWISREKAVDVAWATDNIYMVEMAYTKVTNKDLEHLVNPELGYHSNSKVRRMVNSVAGLAHKCLYPRATWGRPW